MTPFIKKKEIKKDWYIIDAENAAVGRLASYISKVLRGKNKSTFNAHMDNGDFVVDTNIYKIKTNNTPPIFAKRSLNSEALLGTKKWSNSVNKDKPNKKKRLLKKFFSIKLKVKQRHVM